MIFLKELENLINKKVNIHYFYGDTALIMEGTLIEYDKYGLIVIKDTDEKIQVFRVYQRIEEI